MSSTKHTLFEEVSAVFERACHEQDFALAEHLLSALETIARRQKDERQLDLAYLVLAASFEEGEVSLEYTPSRH